MDLPIRLDRALCSNQRLTDHLPAENTLPANLRAVAAEKIHFKRFKIKRYKQLLHGRGLFAFQYTRFFIVGLFIIGPSLFIIGHGQPVS